MDGDAGSPTWDNWLRGAGVAVTAASARGLKINSAAAVPEAAIDGRGVALAGSVMAHDDVASGRLVRLFPSIRLASPLSCYVVCRAECAGLPRAVACRRWLMGEAG